MGSCKWGRSAREQRTQDRGEPRVTFIPKPRAWTRTPSESFLRGFLPNGPSRPFLGVPLLAHEISGQWQSSRSKASRTPAIECELLGRTNRVDGPYLGRRVAVMLSELEVRWWDGSDSPSATCLPGDQVGQRILKENVNLPTLTVESQNPQSIARLPNNRGGRSADGRGGGS